MTTPHLVTPEPGRAASDARRLRRAVLLLVLLSAVLPGRPASGQEEAAQDEEVAGLVELTLEQLLEAQFIPANVLGSHIHPKGEWMIGYRYMFMDMHGNRDGEDRLAIVEVLQEFPITPTSMTTESHMFELMAGVTDRVTFMVMIPYLRKSMDHATRAGGRFTTTSEGIGDVRLMSHVVLSHRGPHWWLFTPAISFPSGSIEARDDTPAGPDQKLPYPMQLGSGSIDVGASLNYLYQGPRWLLGFHAMGRFATETNDNGYKVGDRYHGSLFAALKLSDRFALSWRLDGSKVENYDGADPDLDRRIVHTADPERRAGERIDVMLGLNFYFAGREKGGNRLLLEGGVPVFQSLEGPQLENDLTLNLSWQWTF